MHMWLPKVTVLLAHVCYTAADVLVECKCFQLLGAVRGRQARTLELSLRYTLLTSRQSQLLNTYMTSTKFKTTSARISDRLWGTQFANNMYR